MTLSTSSVVVISLARAGDPRRARVFEIRAGITLRSTSSASRVAFERARDRGKTRSTVETDGADAARARARVCGFGRFTTPRARDGVGLQESLLFES